MKHVIRTEYVDEDGEHILSVMVEVPATIWLQVANYDNPEEASPRDEWTFHDERVMENDVAYVPLSRTEAAERERDALRSQLESLGLEVSVK